MTDAVQDGLTTVAVFVPRLVGFLAILLVGWLLARLLASVVGKLLDRVGFDRAVERGGVGRALEGARLDPSDVVEKLVYYTLLLFVLQLAFSVFGPNPVSDLLERLIAFLPGLIVAVVIVVVAAAIASAVRTVVQGTLGGLSYGRVLGTLAGGFVLFLGVVAALEQVGVATAVTTPVLVTVLATIGGVVVVGVGGGLVRPMQRRWESYLSTAEAEAPKVREQARLAPSPSEQLRAEAWERSQGTTSGTTGSGTTTSGTTTSGTTTSGTTASGSHAVPAGGGTDPDGPDELDDTAPVATVDDDEPPLEEYFEDYDDPTVVDVRPQDRSGQQRHDG